MALGLAYNGPQWHALTEEVASSRHAHAAGSATAASSGAASSGAASSAAATTTPRERPSPSTLRSDPLTREGARRYFAATQPQDEASTPSAAAVTPVPLHTPTAPEDMDWETIFGEEDRDEGGDAQRRVRRRSL